MKRLSGLKFHDEAEIEGTAAPPDRDAERREQRLRDAMRGPWQEIPRGRLEIDRHFITDSATGELFTVYRGDIDFQHSPIVAYYLAEGENAVFLERYAGARTVDELAEQREKRAHARAERMRPRVRP